MVYDCFNYTGYVGLCVSSLANHQGHLLPPWASAPPSSASSRRRPRLPTGEPRCRRGRAAPMGPSPYGQLHMLKLLKSQNMVNICKYHVTERIPGSRQTIMNPVMKVYSRIKTWNLPLSSTWAHLRGWAGALLSLLSHRWRFNETRPSTSALLRAPSAKRRKKQIHDHSLKSKEHPWVRPCVIHNKFASNSTSNWLVDWTHLKKY